jgi:dipeptidase E
MIGCRGEIGRRSRMPKPQGSPSRVGRFDSMRPTHTTTAPGLDWLWMRLFLASSRPGSGALALAELAGPGARAAIVANALDNLPGFPRDNWLAEERRALENVGLSTRELDLRRYYDDPSRLGTALAEVELVWVTGGNTFVLREALRRSTLDTLLVNRVADDDLVYGGYSAGACVCGPTLRGLELVDDVSAVPSPTWDGLGLIDFSLAPHYRSQHPEAAAIQRVVAHFRAHEMPYRTVRDGQALIWRDGVLSLADVH